MDKEYIYKWGVWPEVNQQIQLFNTGLEGLLEGLNADPPGVRLAYLNAYDAVYKISSILTIMVGALTLKTNCRYLGFANLEIGFNTSLFFSCWLYHCWSNP
jgi:hypothetical protein